MKIHNIIILLLIVTPLFFGCIEKDQSYKDFASEELDFDKEYVMSSCKIICKTNKEDTSKPISSFPACCVGVQFSSVLSPLWSDSQQRQINL